MEIADIALLLADLDGGNKRGSPAPSPHRGAEVGDHDWGWSRREGRWAGEWECLWVGTSFSISVREDALVFCECVCEY